VKYERDGRFRETRDDEYSDSLVPEKKYTHSRQSINELRDDSTWALTASVNLQPKNVITQSWHASLLALVAIVPGRPWVCEQRLVPSVSRPSILLSWQVSAAALNGAGHG
jgi:hypothetical protein